MTQSNVSHSRRWQRARQCWLAGFLFGCLLPMTLCHPQALQRLEALSVHLTEVALPVSAQCCYRRRCGRFQQAHQQWQRKVRQLVRQIACLRRVIPRTDAGLDVLSRRGPPLLS